VIAEDAMTTAAILSWLREQRDKTAGVLAYWEKEIPNSGYIEKLRRDLAMMDEIKERLEGK
jgi:hypothetical protein